MNELLNYKLQPICTILQQIDGFIIQLEFGVCSILQKLFTCQKWRVLMNVSQVQVENAFSAFSLRFPILALFWANVPNLYWMITSSILWIQIFNLKLQDVL